MKTAVVALIVLFGVVASSGMENSCSMILLASGGLENRENQEFVRGVF
jgi:hypothetical protein